MIEIEDEFIKLLNDCKTINEIVADNVSSFHKELSESNVPSKLMFQKMAILSGLEWLNKISNNFISLYNVEKEDAYFTIVPLNRFAVELMMNYEVIYLLPKLISAGYIYTGKYFLFDKFKNSKLKHNELIRELLTELLAYNVIHDKKNMIISQKTDDENFNDDFKRNIVVELLKIDKLKIVLKRIVKTELISEIDELICELANRKYWDNSNPSERIKFLKAAREELKRGKKTAISVFDYIFRLCSGPVHGTVLTSINYWNPKESKYYYHEMCNSIMIFYTIMVEILLDYNEMFNLKMRIEKEIKDRIDAINKKAISIQKM